MFSCIKVSVNKNICLMAVLLLCSSVLNAEWIDRTDNGGLVTASSQIHEGESKEMAFDNTTSTKWLTDHTGTGWIQFQFPNSAQYTVTKYSISSANDSPERDPASWVLYGSNDDSSWNMVDSKSGQSWNDRFLRKEFTCSYPGAYNYYRLDITSNYGGVTLTGFSEMELLENVYLAKNPTPADSQAGVSYDSVVLSWDKPSELSGPEYIIYLSENLEDVVLGDSAALLNRQYETSLSVSGLNTFSTYYWRVDVVGGGSSGSIWSFYTQQPDIDCLALLADINSNCYVDMAELEILASEWLLGDVETQLSADIDKSSTVDMFDFAKVSTVWEKTGEAVVIHEIMADNETTLEDNFGEYSDWIELRNLSGEGQNLSGWFLTDDPDELNKWEFPEVTIAPKGYLIVFASDRDFKDDPANLHLNFKLSKGGQYLALVKPDMTVAHEFSPGYPELGNDESYGLTVLGGENTFVTCLLSEPTPNAENSLAVVWGKPDFSEPSGFCDEPFDLELGLDDDQYEIRYTLDGSIPNGNSELYSGPLAIAGTTCIRAAAFKDKYLAGKPQTRSYIFLSDVVQQSGSPDGFPDYWKTTAADYEMDPDIVNDPTYGPLLLDSLKSLPSISIVTDLDNLFDSNTGIYSNPIQEGVEWERPAFVEMLTQDGSDEFQIDCGLRIQGGAFRRFDLSLKKSFRFVFKRKYGSGKLDFPMFDYDSDATESYDTITLRAGANDGYTWYNAYQTEQYIRDEFGRGVQRDSGNTGAHGSFVHLYVNGLYWGLYNTVERPDNSFSATYNGGDKDDWDAINSGDISEGTMDAWNSLISKCQAGVGTIAAYQELQGKNPDGSRNPLYPDLIDMENYIDYIIINMWGGNNDWPWRNYWVGRNRTEDSDGFQFYCWDYEGTMTGPASIENKVSADFNSGAGVPHHCLKSNSEYRMLFADRVHKMFFNGGALSTDVNIQRYSALADWVEPAIVAESARWGDMHHEPPLGLSEWEARRDLILNDYLPNRTDVVLGQMRDAGYYPDIDAPEFLVDGVHSNGGYVDSGSAITMGIQSEEVVQDILITAAPWPVKVHIVADDSLGLSWTEPGFVTDSSWTDGSTTTGVGYEVGSGYESLINTNIQAGIYEQYTSAYCLLDFECTDLEQVEGLTLYMKYDDGFIAYINGVEVCRSDNITSDVPGSASAKNHEADEFEQFDISDYVNVLNDGVNVLAVHGINYSTGSSDMIILPALAAARKVLDTDIPVLYTTDGSDPRMVGGEVNPDASYYSAPVSLNGACQLKARTYIDGQWSALNEAFYAVDGVVDSLRITEIMYHQENDPNSEFIELMNTGSESINLNYVKFTKGIDFEFGDLELAPAAYVVIAANAEVFAELYPDFAGTLAGEYSGNLSNSGERIKIVDALGTEVIDFEYKDSWYDITDGEGFSLVIKDPYAADVSVWDEKDSWAASSVVYGSPGYEGGGEIPVSGAIVINEILAHSDTIEYDWIELYNTTNKPINIGGWYLSDDNDTELERMKYRITADTIVPANGYIVFNQNEHFGNTADPGCSQPFQLSENGEAVYLQSGSNGVLTGYYEEEDFGATQKDVALGRYVKANGNVDFVPMSYNTPGYKNAYPKVGPLVITEIMYHPEDNSDAEYVELQNISGSPLALYDYETGVSWRFVDDKDDIGLNYNFPTASPVVLANNEKILLVKDLAAFESEFGTPAAGVKVFEWGDGGLSNSDEKPEIQMPGDIDEQMERFYIRIDRVSYDDDDPWSDDADGEGMSLTRISTTSYGNDPDNWQAAEPTPGI